MNTIAITSAVKVSTKKGGVAVVINGEYTVSTSSDGRYFVAHNTAKGAPVADQECKEYIAAFEKHIIDSENSRLAAIEAARIAEENRVSAIRERILKCETPRELADEFGLSLIETASHWSDLYEGRSSYAVNIDSREDYEVMEMAVSIHGIEGNFGETCHRDGEHHSTFSNMYSASLEEYQEDLKNHFNGDKFFFKSQEDDKDFYCEQIAEAAADGDMDKVQSLVKDFNELEAGYYDCNGNLRMSAEDLNNPDRAGYNYDVYNYSFAYQFDFKGSFVEPSDDESDEENED